MSENITQIDILDSETPKPKRARDYGWVPSSIFETGSHNAITDVSGVLVGNTTLIVGDPGPLEIGCGPIRTGVTAIRPHPGDIFSDRVTTGVHILNGYGKTIGFDQINILGNIETPILLTNTLSVWSCADALVDWVLKENPEIGITAGSVNPIVGETYDGWLNDLQGRHITRDHVFTALENAVGGLVDEGGVGAGTGMLCYQFKSGIGTASRVLPEENGGFTLGVLVLTNFGNRKQLMIRGHQVGLKLVDWPHPEGDDERKFEESLGSSCMMIIATDAPLSSRQLVRVATRSPLGLARTGFTSHATSGDYALAFSTTNRRRPDEKEIIRPVDRLVDEGVTMSMLFQAVVDATDEAVLNSIVAAKTLEGRDGHIAHAVPIDLINSMIFKNP